MNNKMKKLFESIHGYNIYVFICVLSILAIYSGHSEAVLDTSGIDQAGTDWGDAVKEIANGNVGKAIFYTAIMVAIIALFTKRRAIMIVAFVVGAMFASFTGLVDTAWDFFKDLFG